ncbi:MAG TPA: hypothetical protein VFR09_05835 [Alphaproteobacteria bacterium]|nr:hypothetical protein [Alphaproteobacteria bacterium]
MLPPISCPVGLSGIISWDSQTTMKCVPNLIADNNGNITIGSATSPAALTVNGSVTILSTVTSGTDCSRYSIGTVAQDGTGKLLSCQLVVTGTSPSQTTSSLWQSASTSTVGQYDTSCAYNGQAVINNNTGGAKCTTINTQTGVSCMNGSNAFTSSLCPTPAGASAIGTYEISCTSVPQALVLVLSFTASCVISNTQTGKTCMNSSGVFTASLCN